MVFNSFESRTTASLCVPGGLARRPSRSPSRWAGGAARPPATVVGTILDDDGLGAARRADFAGHLTPGDACAGRIQNAGGR